MVYITIWPKVSVSLIKKVILFLLENNIQVSAFESNIPLSLLGRDRHLKPLPVDGILEPLFNGMHNLTLFKLSLRTLVYSTEVTVFQSLKSSMNKNILDR